MSRRALHPCRDCPKPVPAGTTRCPEHTRAHDAKRGTRQQRGYGRDHDRLRRALQTMLDAGASIPCARCGGSISPGSPWHLDHAEDRTKYLGPAHAHCNLSAAGRAAHQ